jgi:hypothetical protein
VTDIDWVFETSPDLKTWTELGASETANVNNGDLSQITAKLLEPIDATQRTFLRIAGKEQL